MAVKTKPSGNDKEIMYNTKEKPMNTKTGMAAAEN
jgi:hypothetical protein